MLREGVQDLAQNLHAQPPPCSGLEPPVESTPPCSSSSSSVQLMDGVPSPGWCIRENCICLPITNDSHLGNKKSIPTLLPLFPRPSRAETWQSDAEENADRWGHLHGSLGPSLLPCQEQNARLKNGKFRRVPSISHLP